ncbi:AAA family ATPase [Longimicrobium sp.]|jgi:predicted ATPase|uniref:AAA family ATPase n=1 Tax=Longimicrobium sp. TaxID=2029185 RepID=UPI002EDAC65D
MSDPTPMLQRLSLSGFKTVRRLDALELGMMNLLIGPNGAGKSNLISFFRLLNRMATPPGNLQLFVAKAGGASTLLHNGSAFTQDICSDLVFAAPLGWREYGFRLSYAAQDTLIFAQEQITRSHEHERGCDDSRLSMGSGHRESHLIYANDIDIRHMTEGLQGFFADCLVYQFHNTSETARIRQRWSVTDNRSLKEDGANLAPFLLRILQQHPPHYQRITSTLRQIASYFADFVLEPEGDSVLLRWREIGSDIVFGPHQASDGTLRAMALIALLMQPTAEMPSIIILDEPELGLHPRAIAVLAGLLQAASLHRQVIVATQSSVLLDHFEPEQVIVGEREGSESVFRRLDRYKLESWLEEFTLSDLWDKNVLGGRPH